MDSICCLWLLIVFPNRHTSSQPSKVWMLWAWPNSISPLCSSSMDFLPALSPIETPSSHLCFGPGPLPNSESNSNYLLLITCKQTVKPNEWTLTPDQCVEQYLCNFCSYQQDDWVDWTGLAEFQYNNLIHDATQTTPFYANYGYHPSFSLFPLWKSNIPAASNLLHHLSIIWSKLQAELKLAQESAKAVHDSTQGSSGPELVWSIFPWITHHKYSSVTSYSLSWHHIT